MIDKNNQDKDEQNSKINPDDIQNIKTGFFSTLKKATGQVPLSEEVVASYFCAIDPKTPIKFKAALISALAYFVLPLDAIPDVIPGVGFTDDWGILAAAIAYAAKAITDDHQLDACIWLEKIERCFELLLKKLDLLRDKLTTEPSGDSNETKLQITRQLGEKVQQCYAEIERVATHENKSTKSNSTN